MLIDEMREKAKILKKKMTEDRKKSISNYYNKNRFTNINNDERR